MMWKLLYCGGVEIRGDADIVVLSSSACSWRCGNWFYGGDYVSVVVLKIINNQCFVT